MCRIKVQVAERASNSFKRANLKFGLAKLCDRQVPQAETKAIFKLECEADII